MAMIWGLLRALHAERFSPRDGARSAAPVEPWMVEDAQDAQAASATQEGPA